MTQEERDALRAATGGLRRYIKGTPPSDPNSFKRYIENELSLKVGPSIQALIEAVQAIDKRLTDLENT